MLTTLAVKNLAIVSSLELNFNNGMHVITGETGAGKSIIIDALSIALGERASAEQIRANQTQAEVVASFDISKLPIVQEILNSQGLDSDECVIRRIISAEGPSRAYINGCSVAVQQIKMLAPHLVQIHSQHQHHALLDSDYQRAVLDGYARHPELLQNVKNLYAKWSNIKQQIQELAALQQQTDKLTLLNYQIQELTNLSLQANELQTLDQQHTQLAKAEELINHGQMITNILTDGNEDTRSVLDQLNNALNYLINIQKIAPQLAACTDLVQQAIIQIQECSTELSNYFSKLDLDPEKLVTVEQRLSNIHALARKLKIDAVQIPDHYKNLCAQRDKLAQANQHLEELQQQLTACAAEYQIAAIKLTKSRTKAALKLDTEIMERLKKLEMPNAIFNVKLEALKHNDPTLHGNENIHFMVTTNPGQAPGLLKKIASGGELSRISLAIQVITAQQMAIPTLILDEVDVGISGKTAAIVGQLMRELGANAQILCITHLPQVAAFGQHHFKVSKIQTNKETSTQIIPLSPHQRTEELARLMGGTNITPEAMAHAKRLLEMEPNI